MIGSTTYARPDPRVQEKPDCHTTEMDVKHNMLNKEEKFVKDFEPRPNISAYDGDASEKSFVTDFEPRPNISAYDDNHEEKSFVKDFEPRPNISAYDDDKKVNGENEFEPRPNISMYHG